LGTAAASLTFRAADDDILRVQDLNARRFLDHWWGSTPPEEHLPFADLRRS